MILKSLNRKLLGNIFKLLLVVLFSLLALTAKSQSLEYTVKALYIEKFARFTDWKNSIKGEYFVIAILGESPFKGELEKLAKKSIKIKNKPIKIIYVKNIKEAENSQLVFICASEKKNLTEIINHIQKFDILAISDSPGFCKKGVHFNLYLDESEVRYEVNPSALKKSNLEVEMQLLNLGKIIN